VGAYEVAAWSLIVEHWWQIVGGVTSLVTWFHGRRTGWRWVHGLRRWVVRRANLEYDNQALTLEVQRLEDQVRIANRKIATHEAIQQVLTEQVSYLESQIVSSEPWTPQNGPFRRVSDPPHLRRVYTNPLTSLAIPESDKD
jgi:hypothetical protein